MGELRNCEYCKKLYVDNHDFPICLRCNNKLEDQIKKYVKEHDNPTISDIYKDTGIPEKIVKIYIKRKMIDLNEDVNFCNGKDCYEFVEPGQEYCPQCLKKQKLIEQLKNLYPDQPTSSWDNKSPGSGFHSSLGRRR